MARPVRQGTAYLVGAGPGDPGLLTVRGREILVAADAVIYDRLANPTLLGLARPDAVLIDVGKTPGRHAMTQEEINAAIVEQARLGRSVCRLKGGDPFVFGRGGEEALECLAASVPFEIVPGVTSSIAAAAYAGIPVTHRNVATSFAVITGHENPDKPETQVDWAGIAHGADTLVFLMGIGNLAEITAQLIRHGRAADTPVAVVQWGTWTRQRVVEGTLSTIAQLVADSGLKPPAVTIVGAVAALRERLAWWDRKPLFGRRVVVTRSRTQASDLTDLLTDVGAEAIELPVIAIAARDVAEAVGRLVAAGLPHDWVVFASSNAVDLFFAALAAAGADARLLAGSKVGAVGASTAEALARHGLRADFVPTSFSGEDFAKQVGSPEGLRFLFPGAAAASDDMPRELRARGAEVELLPLYDTVPDPSDGAAVARRFADGEVDAVTFTSSSTVRLFRELLPDVDLSGICLAAIGPRTADTMRELGLEPTVVAATSRLSALVEALSDWWQPAG
ncbi:MAG: uroporphyrinogen-III C-methyltransferase [Armatimonadetes bacterium]|nr:uroporphyrinogen-III C-methyltransferase [Armatimonadota bacterium]